MKMEILMGRGGSRMATMNEESRRKARKEGEEGRRGRKARKAGKMRCGSREEDYFKGGGVDNVVVTGLLLPVGDTSCPVLACDETPFLLSPFSFFPPYHPGHTPLLFTPATSLLFFLINNLLQF
jgi:hypothetical protein